jgi:ribosomal protein S27AE
MTSDAPRTARTTPVSPHRDRRWASRGDDPTDLSMPVHDATQVVDVELVSCPNCGSSNAARRARCGRCGQRLRPDAPPLSDADLEGR